MGSIKDFRNMTEDVLFEALDHGTPRDQYELANQELQRRYLREIGTQTASLAASSNKLEGLTITLK